MHGNEEHRTQERDYLGGGEVGHEADPGDSGQEGSDSKLPLLVLNSDECFESFADPSFPVISYENLLRTATPPEVKHDSRSSPDFIKRQLRPNNSSSSESRATQQRVPH